MKEALKLALEALENSIDIVRNEYETDWRHGLPTRLAQLASMKAEIEAHEQAITECKEALAQPVQGLDEAAIRADEREVCAVLAQQTICDTHIPTGINIYGTRAAKAIRARGEQ